MRKYFLLCTAFSGAFYAQSCDDSSKNNAENSAYELTEYVDSVSNLKPIYTWENLTTIDSVYKEKDRKTSLTIKQMPSEDKLKTEASKTKYAAFKAEYISNIKTTENSKILSLKGIDYRKLLRISLFGEGNIGNDMKFNFVNSKNILGVYRNFVNKVADSKKKYSREDWDEIKTLYEALDTRKNEVEKNLKGKDNIKIAGLKMKFATIVATHRGGAKIKENSNSKK